MVDDIRKKLLNIFNSILEAEISEEQFNSINNLGNLGINSIKFVKLIVAIEEEFDFEFDDESLEQKNFNTVDDLVQYIETQG